MTDLNVARKQAKSLTAFAEALIKSGEVIETAVAAQGEMSDLESAISSLQKQHTQAKQAVDTAKKRQKDAEAAADAAVAGAETRTKEANAAHKVRMAAIAGEVKQAQDERSQAIVAAQSAFDDEMRSMGEQKTRLASDIDKLEKRLRKLGADVGKIIPEAA